MVALHYYVLHPNQKEAVQKEMVKVTRNPGEYKL